MRHYEYKVSRSCPRPVLELHLPRRQRGQRNNEERLILVVGVHQVGGEGHRLHAARDVFSDGVII